MRWFSRSAPRRALVIVFAVTAIALLAGWFALPALVRMTLAREAEARGVRLEADEVRVGFTRLSIADAKFRREGDGLEGEVALVEIDAPLFALATRGARAIEEIRVRDAQLALTLSARDDEADEVEESGAEKRPALPRIHVERMGAQVGDGAGELGSVFVSRLDLEGGRVSFEVEALEVGPPELRLASATRLEGAATLEPRQVTRIDVDAVDLTGLADEERVRAFWSRVRAVRGEAEVDEEGGREGAKRALSGYGRLLERLSPNFELVLGRAALPHREGEAFVLEDSGIERRSGSRVRIHGGGRGPEDSRALFDVEIDAAAIRAGGKVEVEALSLDAIAGLVPWIPWYEPERGRLSASLSFEASSPTEIEFRGALDVDDLGIEAARIASEPIEGLDFSLAGTGRWDVEARRLSVESGTFGLGSAKVEVKGDAVLRSSEWAISLEAQLPRTSCDDAVHAFPSAILGGASEFELRGTLAGSLRLEVEANAPEDLELAIRVDDRCRFVEWPRHADPARFRALFVHEALDPAREPFDFETGPRTEVWTDLEEVSPYLIAAVLAHEDAQFFKHHGFSPFAIRGSLARNIAAGRFERGASTISMQLAKNLFLNREKVLVRKLREVIYTWWLEKGFGKESILELYLNVVEFGPHIYGVRNASLHYFGREPFELSPAEATFLANLLPSPKTGAYHYERGELSRPAKNRIVSLLKNMGRRELLSEEAVEYGLSEVETFSFHREGAPPPPPRTLPPTHPLFEHTRPSRSSAPMHEEGFDPWGFP